MRSRLVVWAGAIFLAVGMLTTLPVSASSGDSGGRDVGESGTTSISDGSTADPAQVGVDESASAVDEASPPSGADRSDSSGQQGEADAAGDTAKNDGNPQLVTSFDGLNHVAQRTANGGNQVSIEPPEQGLCAGNGFVLESVNDVLAAYNTSGVRVKGPVDLNTFYGYPAAVNRATGVIGPSITDPSCYFDGATQRWFQVVLTMEVVATGPFRGRQTGVNHVDIAVSQSSSPLGAWKIYHIYTQNDGTMNTPDHHCLAGAPTATWRTNPSACLGDFPHIGADAYGFYVTTNEYSFFVGPEFKAAQVYAFSKQALAANAPVVHMTEIDTTNKVRGNQAGFTVWPAVAPNGAGAGSQGDNESAGRGTEFFLSSNGADEVNALHTQTSRDLVVWALTNTRSLTAAQPDLSLTATVVSVGRYSVPPAAQQKAGPTPLADCLNDTSLPVSPTLHGCWRLLGIPEPTHTWTEAQHIDTADTRMQQVVFAGGTLYGALGTGLAINGKTEAGIEWFAVRPHLSEDSAVRARVVKQGYLGRAGATLSFPAIAVNEQGVGAIAFSLLGPNDYPSAAYAPFNAKRGTDAIHVAAAGVGPDDGFTAYPSAFNSGTRTRWGDYGAAVVDGSNIWMASEYIGQTCSLAQWLAPPLGTCGLTRAGSANWATRITELKISDQGNAEY